MTQKIDHDWKCLVQFFLFWCMFSKQKTGIWTVTGLFVVPMVCVIPEATRNDYFWLVYEWYVTLWYTYTKLFCCAIMQIFGKSRIAETNHMVKKNHWFWKNIRLSAKSVYSSKVNHLPTNIYCRMEILNYDHLKDYKCQF